MLVVGLAMRVHGYKAIYEHICACVHACVCMHSHTADACKHVPMVSMCDGKLILYMSEGWTLATVLGAHHCRRQ